MTPKKYKLLKDLPNAKAGTEYKQTLSGDEYTATVSLTGSWDICYPKEYIENNPEWFQEVNQRIEVRGIKKVNLKYDLADPDYVFSVSKSIPIEKYDAINKAIDVALNGGNENDLIQQIADKCKEEILLEQQKRLGKEEAAFNAARRRLGPGTTNKYLFDNFSDYKNTHP